MLPVIILDKACPKETAKNELTALHLGLLSANTQCNDVLMLQNSDISVVKRKGRKLLIEMTCVTTASSS